MKQDFLQPHPCTEWFPIIKSHVQKIIRDYAGGMICEKRVANQDQRVDAKYGIMSKPTLGPQIRDAFIVGHMPRLVSGPMAAHHL